MRSLLQIRTGTRVFFACWFSALTFLAVPAAPQQTPARVTTVVDDAVRTTIVGTRPPLAKIENDAGRVPSGTPLQGIQITFRRTPGQEADLQALISAQQEPASPLYQKWLTPDEFAARFGVADSDIARVRSWLDQHGFTVEDFSTCNKTCVRFSGTVEQVETVFDTELHYYQVTGETHFAPSRDVSVPTALASVVETVTNLSTFRPKPHIRFQGPREVAPNFTSGQTGSHFLTPKDVAMIYDVNPAYSSGYNGSGQSIAVVGQSSVVLTDIEHFQTAAGFTVHDPTLVLVPNTGTAATHTGDETESDLDLEYTSTIASGATIYFVYVGNSPTNSVFDAIQYAVVNKTAPIISVSYGICEPALGSAGYGALNPVFAQAAVQGQSVIAATGDNGSTDCYGETGLSTAEQQALAIDFPASSPYVTALGGTEFLAADVASTNTTFWQPSSGSSDVVSSALSYIPEQVWNDDTATGSPDSGGGGVSTFASRPSWQAGVPNIPSGTFRLVPDVSLTSSPVNAGYLFCSSDSSLGITGSCSNGFRDSGNKYLTVAGGTSFAAPVFAGMVAIINDKLGSTGQGVVSSTLYPLAANSTTYGKAFHDIATGGNQCTLGSTICTGAAVTQYTATAGYDEASGLGSVDFFNLLSVWPGSSTTLVNSKTTLSAATTTPASGANDAITIKVASASTSTASTPTGTLTIVVDGTLQTSSLALVNSFAVYTFSSTVAGSHIIAATYSGDSTYASSNSSLTVTVPTTPVAVAQTVTTSVNTPKAITLAATPGTAGDTLTYTIVSNPTHGTLSGTAPNVTYTPATGYVGSDGFTFVATENGTVSNTATVSITVTAGPPPPVANNQSVSTNENTAVAITLTGTPGTSGDTLTFAIATSPAHGTLSGIPPNMTYSPTTGYVGADSFTFKLTENNGAASSTPGTVSISVVRPPPVASKTTLAAATSAPAPGASDAITITVASASASSTTTPTGTLTIVVDGTVVTSSLALTSDSASYNFSSTTSGSHTVTATYSGDTNYASSTGSVKVTVTTPPPAASKTTLAAVTSTPVPGASDAITVTVSSSSASSTTTPTGTLTITVDGTVVTSSLTLTSGSASYNFSSSAAGAHTITATYSGDSTYASSTGSVTVTVSAKSFQLAATNVTVAAGGSGNSIVTITPQNGYTGTISWAVSSSPPLSDGCFSIANTTVSGTSAASATLTINTIASLCPTPAVAPAGRKGQIVVPRDGNDSKNEGAPLASLRATHAGIAIAGLLFVGFFGHRSRGLSALAATWALAAIGFALSGCASASSSSSPPPSTPSSPTAAKGTYTVNIIGTDSTSTPITASTILMLTVD